MRTAQDIVSQEVHYCISSLVSTLAGGYGFTQWSGEMDSLTEQAWNLASAIDDWEEAAIQANAKIDQLDDGPNNGKWIVLDQPADSDMYVTFYDDRRNASIAYCDFHGIDPYQREVFEHWIVSDWLADKLEAAGEKVDRDFAGMTVWARTTTGQAIYADGFFEQLAASLSA